jgi:hypothetical protein
MIPLLPVKLAEDSAATKGSCYVICPGKSVHVWLSTGVRIVKNLAWPCVAVMPNSCLTMPCHSMSSKADLAVACRAGSRWQNQVVTDQPLVER